MTQNFQPFQFYSSAEEAQPLLDALAKHHIETKASVDEGKLAFDPTFANNSFVTSFIIKLRPADFEQARQLQEQLNAAAISEADPSHYLFTFTDNELLDILAKPDEWSSFDVALAGQLLRQHGRDISPAALGQLRQRRVAELAQPEPSRPFWIVLGYAFALLGGMAGLLIGYHLHFHRKPLPDGRRVYAYSPATRMHGLVILLLAVAVLIVIIGRQALI